MRSIHYLRFDVFCDRAFAGNQLAVIPLAASLEPELMQRIANEFSLPETAFLSPSTNERAEFRLRIFTPEQELPMAGHPTIGSTFALAHAGMLRGQGEAVVLELGVGPTRVDLEWGSEGLERAWMSQKPPESGPTCEDPNALARVLRLTPADLFGADRRAQVLSSGVPFFFVPVRSRAAVDRIQLDRARLVELCEELGLPETPVYAFTLESGADDARTYSRMFAPGLGIAEDPATGGASGPLGVYVETHCPDAIPRAGAWLNLQGVKMGRPSRIFISLGADAQGGASPSKSGPKVGGEAIYVGAGTLSI